MKKLAIIHTSPATVDVLKELAAELLPDYQVMNLMDDSILPQLAQNGGQIDEVSERVTTYAKFAEQGGADVILEACSSIGELCGRIQAEVQVPVVRIDDAMTERAVGHGSRIGVAATLRTTVAPTTRLLQEKAKAAGKTIELKAVLIEGAYERLMAGDKAGHDAQLIGALTELATWADLVVLSQASMARVVPNLPEALQGKILSSPRPGMERVKDVVEGKHGATGNLK